MYTLFYDFLHLYNLLAAVCLFCIISVVHFCVHILFYFSMSNICLFFNIFFFSPFENNVRGDRNPSKATSGIAFYFLNYCFFIFFRTQHLLKWFLFHFMIICIVLNLVTVSAYLLCVYVRVNLFLGVLCV